MANFDGTDAFFDSREVIERIAELEEIGTEENSEGIEFDADRLCDEFREEYDSLIALQDEVEGYISDWQYGAMFISEDYFTDYAEELVKDVGYIPADLPEWIKDNINWDGVADALKVDYTEFEFRGTTYYAR